MRASLFPLIGSGLLATALVACGGGGSSNDLASPQDLTTTNADGNVACTTVATWASDEVHAFYKQNDPSSGFDYEVGVYGFQAGTGATVDSLEYDYYQVDGGASPTLPRTFAVDPTATYLGCSDCLLLEAGGTQSLDFTGSKLFFARSGSITVTQADRSDSGTVAVKGTNLHLVEWTIDSSGGDYATPNGGCFDVGSFTFSGTYDNGASDGGASDM